MDLKEKITHFSSREEEEGVEPQKTTAKRSGTIPIYSFNGEKKYSLSCCLPELG
jgi:hypothetical protein